jgi:hypothetical protein
MSVGLGVRAVYGGEASRLQRRTVFILAVMQEGAQAGGRVAGRGGSVTRVCLIVPFGGFGEDPCRPFHAAGQLRFAEIGADLTSIKLGFGRRIPSRHRPAPVGPRR